MSIIGWIVLGLIAGWIGSNIVDNGGRGPLVDSAIFSALGAVPITGFNLYSLFVAVVGAVIVLVIYHALVGRRRI